MVQRLKLVINIEKCWLIRERKGTKMENRIKHLGMIMDGNRRWAKKQIEINFIRT